LLVDRRHDNSNDDDEEEEEEEEEEEHGSVRQLLPSTMDPEETESYCREQHRMFVESMEQYMVGSTDREQQGAAAAAAASNHPASQEPSPTDSPPSLAPWRRMSADLGWSPDRVELHAYLYYAALCDDRRNRKRRRRMERQASNGNKHHHGTTTDGQEHQQEKPTVQEETSRVAPGDAAATPAVNRNGGEGEAGLASQSPSDNVVDKTAEPATTIRNEASGDQSATREPSTKDPTTELLANE
jgi:hypothetical protein